MNQEYFGKWRIIEMDNWDQDYVDLVAPGHITIEKRESYMEFGALSCNVDFRIEEFGGLERLEFSFEGRDEGDPVCGRGWGVVEARLLKGHIYFHGGDDSGFIAERQK